MTEPKDDQIKSGVKPAEELDTEKHRHPDEQVWRVCKYLISLRDISGSGPTRTCRRCPRWVEMPHYGKGKQGCRAQAEEVINIVETGNPWRKSREELAALPGKRWLD